MRNENGHLNFGPSVEWLSLPQVGDTRREARQRRLHRLLVASAGFAIVALILLVTVAR